MNPDVTAAVSLACVHVSHVAATHRCVPLPCNRDSNGQCCRIRQCRPPSALQSGSDDHAKSTAALYSLVASARLHGLDPEEYLRCLIRLVPLWPADRMLELAPLFWPRTRARLDAKQLAAEFGDISIPDKSPISGDLY